MLGEITKEELLAFTESNIAQAKALTKICDALDDISIKLDKMIEKFNNGLRSDIVRDIVGGGDQKTTLNAIKQDTADNKQNIREMKFLVGIVSLAIVIATVTTTVILRGIDNRKLFSEFQQVITEQQKVAK
jgi:hypothetical protein